MELIYHHGRCTPDEYLSRERAAEGRHEYIEGRMRPMPRNNRWHNLIVGALLVEIGRALKGRRCEAFAIQTRVKVPATGLYTYPDLVALCGDAVLEDKHNGTLLNPLPDCGGAVRADGDV